MALEPGFLRPKSIIKRSRITTGIILGVAFSYIFYRLIYLLREYLRILVGIFAGWPLELTPAERFYYNLFYGSITAIIGLYIFFKYSLESSISFTNKKLKLKQRHVLTDQGFFAWSFLNAFSRMAFVIGIFFISFLLQFEMNFLKEKIFLLILIPIVLFLSLWPVILKNKGRKAYQWMLYSFVSVSVLSLIYANLNYTSYQHMDQFVKKRNLVYRYNIDLPASKNHHYIRRLSRVADLYIAQDTIPPYKPFIIINDVRLNTINVDDIRLFVSQEKDKLPEVDRSDLIFNLHIDKDIKMAYINRFEHALRKSGVNWIQYSTGVKSSKYPSYYPPFKYRGIRDQLVPYNRPLIQFLDSAEQLDLTGYKIDVPKYYRINDVKNYSRIKVRVTPENVFINNSKVSDDQLENFTYQFIKKYAPDYAIIFDADDQITYQRYIEIKDIIYYNIHKLRNNLAYETYNEPYDNLYGFEQMKIKVAYPRNIVEWTPEEKRLMELMRNGEATQP